MLRPVAFGLLFAATWLVAGEPAIVSHISVTSDKVEDVSSIDAWKKAFIKEGMTDQQKALTVWTTVVKFRHQDPPPLEFFTGDGGDVHDPLKTFNVYGYNMCCCESSNICALARAAGLKARGWGINGHSVPEIFFDGAWHLFDASLVCYFKKSDGTIAGVEDIIADVGKWYDKNPDFRKNNDKLYKFGLNGGWKKGPEILANTTAYDINGWLPAATHGWYSTMQEYDGRGGGKDGKAFLYEYGYSQGYEVNIQLRPGERITRNWSNSGEHINKEAGGGDPGALNEKVGSGQLRYTPALGDLAPGRVGNGVVAFDVPNFKELLKSGEVIIRMHSNYVYLSGAVFAHVPVGTAFDVSVDNGLSWKNVELSKPSNATVLALKPFIHQKYDYLLRVRIAAKSDVPDDSTLALKNIVQLSQRALPALDKGDNTITFHAGPDEGTVTIEALGNLEHKAKQLSYLDYHPTIENLEDKMLLVKGGAGSIAFPIKTPGDMTRLRFGSFYRARDAKDGWDYQVSFDNGKTYQTIDRAAGPTGNGLCKYVVFNAIPPGTKEALVRFSGQQRNTTMISSFRIDADYKEPNGGFKPVKITYEWREDGREKKDIHIAKTPRDTYTIHCKAKPEMNSITLELDEPQP